MIVSMWMMREVITIDPHTNIAEASELMARNHIRRLPVVERHDHDLYPVGIVTATDILHAFPPSVNPFAVRAADSQRMSKTAGDIMSRALRTVTPETPIDDAARIMRDGKISTLLVVQKSKLVGLITESDIFRAFVGILESTGAGARITFEIRDDEDVFGRVAPIALKHKVHVVSLMTMMKEERKICVVRAAGAALDDFINALWDSGHSVLNIIRY